MKIDSKKLKEYFLDIRKELLNDAAPRTHYKDGIFDFIWRVMEKIETLEKESDTNLSQTEFFPGDWVEFNVEFFSGMTDKDNKTMQGRISEIHSEVAFVFVPGNNFMQYIPLKELKLLPDPYAAERKKRDSLTNQEKP